MGYTKKSKKASSTGKNRNSPVPQPAQSQSVPRASRRSTRATHRSSISPHPGLDDDQQEPASVSPARPTPAKLPRPTAKRSRIRNEEDADSPSRLQDITAAVDRAGNVGVVDRAAELREARQARLLKQAIDDNARLRGELKPAIFKGHTHERKL